MRTPVLLLAALALLPALSGCFGDDPPEVVLVTVAGRITESGPAYGPDQPDTCGVSARSVELEQDPVTLTYVGNRPAVGAMRNPLVLVGGYTIDRMHVGSCGDQEVLGGARWADGAQVVAISIEGYTESRLLEARGGRLQVDGQRVAEGETVRVPFLWIAEVRPTADDARNGTYEYRGEVLVTHLATVPSHRVRAVADCGGLPSGC